MNAPVETGSSSRDNQTDASLALGLVIAAGAGAFVAACSLLISTSISWAIVGLSTGAIFEWLGDRYGDKHSFVLNLIAAMTAYTIAEGVSSIDWALFGGFIVGSFIPNLIKSRKAAAVQ